MLRQDKATFTSFEEINVRDIIILKENVLVFGDQKWLQQRTDPCFERTASVFQKIYSSIGLLMDEERNLDLELVWQFLDELV